MKYLILGSVLFFAVVSCSQSPTSEAPKVQDKVTAEAPRPAAPAPQASPEAPTADVQASGETTVPPPPPAENQPMPENSSATTATTKY